MKTLICSLIAALSLAGADEPKKDDEAAKEKLAIMRANLIEQEVKGYFLLHQEWPKELKVIAPFLESKEKGLLDPWEKPYQFKIVAEKVSDGSIAERPYVWTERVVGKETKVYGKKPPEKKK